VPSNVIERYVEQNEAVEGGTKLRAKEIEFEIKELKREMEEVEEWPNANRPSGG
jgi:hypothetical protein